MKELEYAGQKMLHFLVGRNSEYRSKEEMRNDLYREMALNSRVEEEIRQDMFTYYRIRYNLALVSARFKRHEEGIRYDRVINIKPPEENQTLALFQLYYDGETFTHRSDLGTHVSKEDEMVLTEMLLRKEENRGVKDQMKKMFHFLKQPLRVIYRTHEEIEDYWVFHLLINEEPAVFRVRKEKVFMGILIPSISKSSVLHDLEREQSIFTYLTETSPFRMIWLYQ